MNSIMPSYMAQALYQYEFHNAKVHDTCTIHYIIINSIMPRYMAQALDTINMNSIMPRYMVQTLDTISI
jgi:hypothetical protein